MNLIIPIDAIAFVSTSDVAEGWAALCGYIITNTRQVTDGTYAWMDGVGMIRAGDYGYDWWIGDVVATEMTHHPHDAFLPAMHWALDKE